MVILVVEGLDPLRNMVCELLSFVPQCEIHAAGTIDEAKALAVRPFQKAVIDGTVYRTGDGLELANWLRNMGIGSQLYAFTSFPDLQKAMCEPGLCDGAVPKPFGHISEFYEALNLKVPSQLTGPPGS